MQARTTTSSSSSSSMRGHTFSCSSGPRPTASMGVPHSLQQCQRPQRAAARRSPASAAAGTAAAAGLQCGATCQQPQQCTCGIVIVDHGSRRKASNEMLVEFCQLYQQLTQHAIVQPAHMEIAEPSIAQAIGRCVEAGAQRVVVAPYFLSKGRHIQDDIPALVAAAQEQFPDVSCSIAEPIGIEPLMVKIIQQRVHAALSQECPAVAGTADPVAAAAAVAAGARQL